MQGTAIALRIVVTCWVCILAAPGSAHGQTSSRETPSDVEEIYVFRSFTEQNIEHETDICKSRAPFKTTRETYYSLWSVTGDESTGGLTDVHRKQIGDMHACAQVSADGVKLFAVGTLNGIPYQGVGDQSLLKQTSVVESRVNRFVLEGLPSPYVAGLIASNTVRLSPADAPGYVLSSVAIVRLWKAVPAR